MGRSREWGRGPGKFLNFNQVAFERVWLLLKERERLMLKLRGREWLLGTEACLQAVSCGTPRLAERLGWKSRAPISLDRTRLKSAIQDGSQLVGCELRMSVGSGGHLGGKQDSFFLL